MEEAKKKCISYLWAYKNLSTLGRSRGCWDSRANILWILKTEELFIAAQQKSRLLMFGFLLSLW